MLVSNTGVVTRDMYFRSVDGRANGGPLKRSYDERVNDIAAEAAGAVPATGHTNVAVHLFPDRFALPVFSSNPSSDAPIYGKLWLQDDVRDQLYRAGYTATFADTGPDGVVTLTVARSRGLIAGARAALTAASSAFVTAIRD
jgi:hypothetical protein